MEQNAFRGVYKSEQQKAVHFFDFTPTPLLAGLP
jgi:hypothetical protein